MTSPKKFTDILIGKLTKEELHEFMELYDDGSFDEEMVPRLLWRDKRNYPQDYDGFSLCIKSGKENKS